MIVPSSESPTKRDVLDFSSDCTGDLVVSSSASCGVFLRRASLNFGGMPSFSEIPVITACVISSGSDSELDSVDDFGLAKSGIS